MWDNISQVVIMVTGIASIILVAKKNKWGFLIGLLAQPFWFYTTTVNKQWGLFLLTIAYTFVWSYGIYEWFIKKNKKK
jgi:nicotinamide riboside transporter PnuC